ncbi:deoxyuridine triphosphatase [Bovine alphaherpesvirus 2]|uniref:Deoxyuridine triphosphatase n=1 Tax=Bovine alphaherpesvirus 2 TaxID=10295 RepID=A0A7T1L7M8_9ALPH|nr:deoxyuridine triphosphatase [Bovine alphaherpesvirus 2]
MASSAKSPIVRGRSDGTGPAVPNILVSLDKGVCGAAADWRLMCRTRGRSAQLEVYNHREIVVTPEAFNHTGEAIVTVPLGFRMAMPQNFCAIVHTPRRQLGRYRVVTGLIDSGYRGTVSAVLILSKENCRFAPGALQAHISIHELSDSTPALTEPRAPKTTAPTVANLNGRFALYTGAPNPIPGHPGVETEGEVFLPKRAEDAGTDIAVVMPVEIPPGDYALIQPSYRSLLDDANAEAVYVLGRSSLNNRGLIVAPTRWLPGRACVLCIHNITDVTAFLGAGTKVAQVVNMRHPSLCGVPVENIDSGGVYAATPHQHPARPSPTGTLPPRVKFTNTFDADAPGSARGLGGFGSTDALLASMRVSSTNV